MYIDESVGNLVSTLIWPCLILLFFVLYRHRIRRLTDAVVRRVERGDEIQLLTWVTLGRSAGPLKVPTGEDLITDDHLALIHRSWRVPHRDAEFRGQKMYQIHVILFGEKAALDQVEYVSYILDPAYPRPRQYGGPRKTNFELKELANGYSLIRAEVKIKDQEKAVLLSRFIDLTDTSPPLKGVYLK